MLIGVSTGVLYQQINGINNQLKFFRKSRVDIEGIELSFSSPSKVSNGLKSGCITCQNEAYVRQLKFNSVHLPWEDIVYSKKEYSFLKQLSKLYHKLNARVAVIHPDCVDCLETYDVLLKFFPKLAVENMTSNKATGSSILDIKKIVDYNEKIGVVLDVAHCMESMQSFEKYEQAFHSRIMEIHVSAYQTDKNLVGSSHFLLHKVGIHPTITARSVPLIIEGKISTPEELLNETYLLKSL